MSSPNEVSFGESTCKIKLISPISSGDLACFRVEQIIAPPDPFSGNIEESKDMFDEPYADKIL